MIIQTLKAVMNSINLSPSSVGDVLLPAGIEGTPVPLVQNNFSPVKTTVVDVPVFFIDGGNQQIIGSSQFSIQFIRIYWTKYVTNRRVDCGTDEFFVVAQLTPENGRLMCELKTFGLKRSMLDDALTSMNCTRVELSAAQDSKSFDETRVASIAVKMRKRAELLVAQNIAQKNSGALIVLDGALGGTDAEEKVMMKALCGAASLANVLLVGLSKSSQLVTSSGCALSVTLQALISPSLVHGRWMYHPLVSCSPALHFEIAMVKLHPRSRRVFRVDFSLHSWQQKDKILSALIQNSSDATLIGYPYGLIEADRFARVSNEEAKYLQLLMHDLLAKGGVESQQLLESLAVSDVHGILDSMR
ncbi:DNA double-strand break repair nuclease NurA [Candidatus Woesearchaeota archaeon]|nr:DNA double-strand break repair nuclease NurA [Candidatus Woesearchaeota archaeon]